MMHDPIVETLSQVAAALEANNIAAEVVPDGRAALARLRELVPLGSQVHWGKSKTMIDIGAEAEFNDPSRYDPLRPRYMAMDRRTQMDEIRRLISAPDHMLGSVQAIVIDGTMVVVSNGGAQIGPYAAGAGSVILVIGSQKVVPDLDAAMRRVRDVVFPYEDRTLREQLGVGTAISKTLLIHREPRPGRMRVILVREPVGV